MLSMPSFSNKYIIELLALDTNSNALTFSQNGMYTQVVRCVRPG